MMCGDLRLDPTPPRHVVITRAPDDAVAAIVDYLLAQGIRVPGIGGPRAAAEPFAQRWTAATGSSRGGSPASIAA